MNPGGCKINGNMEQALDDVYRSVIMEHFRDPCNKHRLKDANLTAEGKNPLCGDEMTLELKVEGDKIMEAAFTGNGCAISMAAASMIIERLEGMTVDSAMNLVDGFINFIKNENPSVTEEELGDLATLKGVSQFPMRIKCALLPFTALKAAFFG